MNSLQQLADLILPENIHWWPLAPGWYVLVFLLVMLLVFMFYKKRQHYIKNQYRREAIAELNSLSINNATQLLTILQHTLNHALAMSVELEEKSFLNALNKGVKAFSFDEKNWQLLMHFAYQRPAKEQSVQAFSELKAKCLQWAKEHHYDV